MTHQSVTMRVMADKYEELARATSNPAERQRFGDYVKLYREMAVQFAEAERAEETREQKC
jgi:hypothetical protein